MLFLSPWYLLGLLGVGIPLLVHWIYRQRAVKVVLPTVRFLKRAPKRMVYFQQIQQWLLLLLRAAILTLLAVAFARPIITGAYSELVGKSPRSSVILLDTSMSMLYGDYFDKGKGAVMEILKSFNQGDEAAIITFSDRPEQMASLTMDHGALRAFTGNVLSPGYRSTSFLPALHLADQILQSALYRDRTVYLVSDYQRQASSELGESWKLSLGVKFEGIKVGKDETKNLTVAEVQAPGQMVRAQEEHLILGRIRNVGTGQLTEAWVSMEISGEGVTKEEIDLQKKSEALVKFPVTFEHADVQLGTLTLEGDSFQPDNRYHFFVGVMPLISILCVNGEPSERGREDESLWFRLALDQKGRASFQVDVIDPRQVTSEVLAPYDVVALLNVGDLSQGQVHALQSYVERGGGLFIAPADQVDLSEYNRLYRNLTPGLLKRKTIQESEDDLVIAEVQTRHPVIRHLQEGDTTDFGTARFSKYWSIIPADGSDIIMRFDNGEAALTARTVGNGRVLLFSSSLGMGWNNLPLQVFYLPLLHEAIRYLAEKQDKKRIYHVGDLVPIRMSVGGVARVSSPQGKETVLVSDLEGSVFYQETDIPGFYHVRAGDLLDYFAVNVPVKESDFTSMEPSEIREMVIHPGTTIDAQSGGEPHRLDVQMEKSQGIWWWILLLVLILGFFETLLANRTYR